MSDPLLSEQDEKNNQDSEKQPEREDGVFAKIKRPFIVLVALLLLLIGGGYLAAHLGLLEFATKNEVDRWIESQERQARSEGAEIDISYSELTLQGGLSNRYAVLKNPAIAIAPENVSLKDAGAQVTRFATERLIIYPENGSFENVRLEMPDAIALYDRGAVIPTFSVEPKTPIVVSVAQEAENDQVFQAISHYLPVDWKITYNQLVDEDSGEPLLEPEAEQYQLKLDEGGRYYSRTAAQSHLGEAFFVLQNALLSDEDGAVILKIDDIDAKWKGVLDPQNGRLQSFDVHLDGLRMLSDSDLLAYSPVELIAKLGINETDGASAIIEQLQLKVAESRVQVKGEVSVSQQDPVPLGNIVVQLDNIKALLQTLVRDEMIDENDVHLAQEAAKAIIGDDADLSDDLNFIVSRESGSSFLIGKASVEELFSTVLRSALEGVEISADSEGEKRKDREAYEKIRQQYEQEPAQ